MTIYDYERLTFDNDLSALVISGNPPDEELKTACNSILYEFTSSCGGGKINPGLNSFRRINHNRLQIKRLEICYRIIANGGTEKAYETLKQLRVMVFKDDIQKTLKMIDSKIRSLMVKLSEEAAAYKKESSGKEDKEFTRDDHTKQLAFISKYYGFRIDRKTTTLREYAAYISNIKVEQTPKVEPNGRKQVPGKPRRFK